MEIKKLVGKNIRHYRLRFGISQETLAWFGLLGPSALASLPSAVVNQKGGGITQREGRDDRHERLLVGSRAACLRLSLRCSVPSNFPRPLSRFLRRGVCVRIADPLADRLGGLVRDPCIRSGYLPRKKLSFNWPIAP